MDHHRLPRHSSSHGTLHSSYSHGRSAHGPSPVRPLHKPLRSVNENSVLLPSPGALESMLKTTTETGDIGIFSIKPVPPLPQRRGTFSEISQQRPSPRPSIEELQRRNNGKISLCRDTASEIISMHDSESHKSTTSTLTPTCSDDIGLRSYSMTTCGSRHLSHHKSTTTLQSQASGGPLQRPRSPFPYPTRLKRPGVRPASPALTESGRVDYSRMVEIDRASYRTVHGPYKPSYPPTPRRPAPLGLRADVNLSTVSLPSQGLPPLSRNRPPRPSSIRTHSTASMASYNAPCRERFDSSSSRTSSLTSLVNMYHRTPHTPRVGPSGLSTTVPRYYDYTEGFENKQPRAITPVQPFAPVPTRVSNCHRPLVLQDSDENLAVAFGERDSAFFEAGSGSPGRVDGLEALNDTNGRRVEDYQATVDRVPSRCRTGSIRSESRSIAFDGLETDRRLERGSDIDLLPSQVGRDSMDTFNPSLDLESRDAPTYRYADYRLTATPKTKAHSPERQVQVLGGRAPTIRSEQGVILRDDTQGETLNEDEIHTIGMASSPTGSSSQQQPTFLHTNGKKAAMIDPYGNHLPMFGDANTMLSKNNLSIFDVDIDAQNRSYSSTPASEYPAEPSLHRSAAQYIDLSALDSSRPPSPYFKYREKGLRNEISSSTLSSSANDAIPYPVTIKQLSQGTRFIEQLPPPPQFGGVEDVKPDPSHVNQGKRSAPAVSSVQDYLHRTPLSSNYQGQSSTSSSQQQDYQGNPNIRLNGSSEPKLANNQANEPVKGVADGMANGKSNGSASRPTNGTAHRATSGQRSENRHASTPSQKSQRAQGKRDRIWPWKEGTCHKIAADTWQKIKAFFGLDTTPPPDMANGNVGQEEIELNELPSEPLRSRQKAPGSNSANPTSRPRRAARRGRNRNSNGDKNPLRRTRAHSGSRPSRHTPKDPYDNGFLSAPKSTTSSRGASYNAGANGERASKKTPSSTSQWFSRLL
ncbi:hypothetical protein GL218_07018 [Daldinia childiae]|uniref:uncharacterized protein n=1 Tax=Daldinia childiae TaxID=326645 RepID=UPI0014484F71|nr:uncharacterized protein GL218_07018 [Daldinia childiae]KAF3055578.1 hypothetical protein GL218_07018 [Daldinia childiae]